jgi:hypothetical protein
MLGATSDRAGRLHLRSAGCWLSMDDEAGELCDVLEESMAWVFPAVVLLQSLEAMPNSLAMKLFVNGYSANRALPTDRKPEVHFQGAAC